MPYTLHRHIKSAYSPIVFRDGKSAANKYQQKEKLLHFDKCYAWLFELIYIASA